MLENSKTSRSRGFSLVELMVSITVLLLLLVAVAQIVNTTQNISRASNKSLGADGESRLVFDRMAMDLSRMVKRNDVDYLLNRMSGSASTGANDSLFFYSEAPAFSAPTSTIAQQNSVALVGYRINTQYQLERLSKGLTWSAAPSDGMVFLSYASYPVTSTSTPLSGSTLLTAWPSVVNATSTDANYHVLGPDVFRFEFCYLLNACTDLTGVHQPAIYSNVPYDSRLGHTSITGIGLADVQAFVVSLAILDATSRKGIPSGTNLSTASSLFVDPSNADLATAPPKLMATTWSNLINGGSFAHNAGIPAPVADQVRIYQRLFPLNIP